MILDATLTVSHFYVAHDRDTAAAGFTTRNRECETMAGDRTRIRVAQMARVWLAPVGTAAPGDHIMAMPAGWRDVGYFTPDSLGWSTDPSFEEIRSHQSDYPTRRFQTEDAATIEVDLQEWSGENFIAVYGGGTIVEVPAVPGPPAIALHYKFTPPAVGGRQDVAACVEIIDGTLHYRRIVPVCTQVEGVEQSMERTAESTLPLRLSVIGSDIGSPWYDLTNDPAFEPAA
jgi:hypothetical protein